MSFENSAGLAVLNHYGPRTTNSSFGAVQQTGAFHVATLEFGAPTTTTSTDADFGRTGLQAAAWAVSDLDLVVPVGAIFLRADVVVETAFDALTGLTIGTYAAADGTTAIDADGLVTAAACTLEMINAVGDRVLGAGAQLITGTAALGALTGNAVIRVLYTGTVPTVGKARLIVQYMTPTP